MTALERTKDQSGGLVRCFLHLPGTFPNHAWQFDPWLLCESCFSRWLGVTISVRGIYFLFGINNGPFSLLSYGKHNSLYSFISEKPRLFVLLSPHDVLIGSSLCRGIRSQKASKGIKGRRQTGSIFSRERKKKRDMATIDDILALQPRHWLVATVGLPVDASLARCRPNSRCSSALHRRCIGAIRTNGLPSKQTQKPEILKPQPLAPSQTSEKYQA